MLSRRRGVLVVHFADTHPNSLAGLSPPSIELEEKTHYQNAVQEWYWDKWERLWTEEIPRRKKELNAKEVWAFCVGDGADDNKHSSAGLISVIAHDIVTISVAVHELVTDNCDRFFMLRGTPAHTREYGTLEEMVARMLPKVQESPEGHATWWHSFTECEGVLLYAKHQAPSYSRIPSTRGGAVNRSVRNITIKTAFNPTVQRFKVRRAFWAHGHYAAESNLPRYGWKGYYCPPWQGQTDYGHKLDFEIDPPGAWVTYCYEGQATTELVEFPFDEMEIWKP